MDLSQLIGVALASLLILIAAMLVTLGIWWSVRRIG